MFCPKQQSSLRVWWTQLWHQKHVLLSLLLLLSPYPKLNIYAAIYICGNRRGNIILNIFFQIVEISCSHSAVSLDIYVELFWCHMWKHSSWCPASKRGTSSQCSNCFTKAQTWHRTFPQQEALPPGKAFSLSMGWFPEDTSHYGAVLHNRAFRESTQPSRVSLSTIDLPEGQAENLPLQDLARCGTLLS